MEKASKIFERIWGQAHNTEQGQWKVIAMCVLGATTFWFFTALNKPDYSSIINYPISVTYPGKDSLMVVGKMPDDIRINVTSGGWNLFRKSFGIGVKPIEVRLSSPTDTKYVLGSSLAASISEQVTSFNLNRVMTDTLFFNIETKVTRTLLLAVDPNDLNLAPDHMLIGEVLLDQDSIQVEGPASFVNNLTNTFYLQIDQQGINENFQDDIPLPSDLEGVTWSSQNIGVQFKVDPLVPAEQQLSVSLVNFPKDYGIKNEPRELKVNLKVPSSFVDSLNDTMVELYVDFLQMDEDSMVVPEVRSDHQYVTSLSVEAIKLKVGYGN